jgi:6-phosphofructokinase 1
LKHNSKSEKMSKKRKGITKIGVLTSGGDAPGMNAAVRAVTRTAIAYKLEVIGIRRGYQGMIDGDFIHLNSNDVSHIMNLGGTFLQTARSAEFRTEEGRAKAYRHLKEYNIDAVVCIGGDGSFRGALEFSQEYDIPFVGIPGTIDNDMYGTDYTLGFDTAVNTVIQAVDKIKDTASSHGRIFFVEVMGREAGQLALRAGIASGAEVIFIPEIHSEKEELEKFLNKGYKSKKYSGIVMVAEGDTAGGAFKIAEEVQNKHPEIEVRVSVLGHMQRGGSPSAVDRVAATQMGVAAVDALLDDQKSVMIGMKNDVIVHVPLQKVVKMNRSIDCNLLNIHKIINSV